MRRRLTLLSGTLAVTAGLLWASPARAQTLIGEGGVDGNYETGGNYSGGVAPNNSGAETVQLSGSGTGAGIINIHSAANILGLQGNGYYYLSQVGTGSLTIGAGGIQFQGLEGQYPLFFIDVPIVLGADQAWNEGNEGYFYIDGGITIQRFLRAGLIQRLTITRVPVLIGEGIPLFGALPRDLRLRHITTQHYPSGLVKSEYEVLTS